MNVRQTYVREDFSCVCLKGQLLIDEAVNEKSGSSQFKTKSTEMRLTPKPFESFGTPGCLGEQGV